MPEFRWFYQKITLNTISHNNYFFIFLMMNIFKVFLQVFKEYSVFKLQLNIYLIKHKSGSVYYKNANLKTKNPEEQDIKNN